MASIPLRTVCNLADPFTLSAQTEKFARRTRRSVFLTSQKFNSYGTEVHQSWCHQKLHLKGEFRCGWNRVDKCASGRTKRLFANELLDGDDSDGAFRPAGYRIVSRHAATLWFTE
jgi:hypothetical protein